MKFINLSEIVIDSKTLELAKKVSSLEEDERRISASTNEYSNVEKALEGYAAVLALFYQRYASSFTKSEIKEIEEAYLQLQNMIAMTALDDQIILDLFQQTDLNNRAAKSSLPKIKEAAKSVIDFILSEQNSTKSVLLAYGLNPNLEINKNQEWGIEIKDAGHHEVIKIQFEGNSQNALGRYIVTVYNAGFESNWTDDSRSLVAAKKEYTLKTQTREEAQKLVEHLLERRNLGMEGLTKARFAELTNLIASQLKETNRTNQSKAQTRGNCTTRSTREALSDLMSRELFERFYSFASTFSFRPKTNLNNTQFSPDFLLQGQILQNRLNISSVQAKHFNQFFKLEHTQQPNTTLMHFAILKGNQALLLKGLEFDLANSVVKNKSGIPALHYAITNRSNFAEIIIDQLKNTNNINLLQTVDDFGDTPLLCAIKNNKPDLALKLIQAGVSIKPEDNSKYLPLVLALEQIDLEKKNSDSKKLWIQVAKQILSSPHADILLQDGLKRSAKTWGERNTSSDDLEVSSLANDIKSIWKSNRKTVVPSAFNNVGVKRLATTSNTTGLSTTYFPPIKSTINCRNIILVVSAAILAYMLFVSNPAKALAIF